jgi:hypothetical protein
MDFLGAYEMRTTSLRTSLFYFIMGTLFTYLAIESAHEEMWSFSTVLLMIIATLDFGAALRALAFSFTKKKTSR